MRSAATEREREKGGGEEERKKKEKRSLFASETEGRNVRGDSRSSRHYRVLRAYFALAFYRWRLAVDEYRDWILGDLLVHSLRGRLSRAYATREPPPHTRGWLCTYKYDFHNITEDEPRRPRISGDDGSGRQFSGFLFPLRVDDHLREKLILSKYFIWTCLRGQSIFPLLESAFLFLYRSKVYFIDI